MLAQRRARPTRRRISGQRVSFKFASNLQSGILGKLFGSLPGTTSDWLVIRPGSMPSAEITPYKPTGLMPPWKPDSFRLADNSPRASYFASRNDVSGQRGHLSDYATYQDFKEPYLFA